MSTSRTEILSTDVVVLVVRAVTFGMAAASGLTVLGLGSLPLLVALLLIALAATLLERVTRRGLVVPYLEAGLVSALVIIAGADGFVFLPYLTTAALAAGVRFGAWHAIGVTTLASALLGAAAWSGEPAAELDVLQWALVALGVGLLGAWAREVQKSGTAAAGDVAYRETARLLEDLEPLAQALEAGLEPRPIGESYLDGLGECLPIVQASVAVRLSDGWAVAASRSAPEDPLDPASLLAQAEGWDTSRTSPVVRIDERVTTVLIPVTVDDSPVALAEVRLAPGEEWTPAAAGCAKKVSTTWGLRLRAAVLFQEVRLASSVFERSLLARDMHDGVAQDVASLGYALDDLMDEPGNGSDRESLARLRDEVARIVGELRLSIHDLRDQGLNSGPLAAAIGECARRHGRAAGMDVHLRLGEGSTITTPLEEVELYRIAQEAIVNARRHSQASNLWVSCMSGPGGTAITVEDDGIGLGSARPDRYGLTGMAERAHRIRAEIAVRSRPEGGTVVYVELRQPASRQLGGR